jgi:hypothetical protein
MFIIRRLLKRVGAETKGKEVESANIKTGLDAHYFVLVY